MMNLPSAPRWPVKVPRGAHVVRREIAAGGAGVVADLDGAALTTIAPGPVTARRDTVLEPFTPTVILPVDCQRVGPHVDGFEAGIGIVANRQARDGLIIAGQHDGGAGGEGGGGVSPGPPVAMSGWASAHGRCSRARRSTPLPTNNQWRPSRCCLSREYSGRRL